MKKLWSGLLIVGLFLPLMFYGMWEDIVARRSEREDD